MLRLEARPVIGHMYHCIGTVGQTGLMASWQDIAAAEPDLAENVKARFDAHVHKTLATLRRDGSPRISGIEIQFKDGDMWFGTMPGSMKAQDLLRDGRIAVHSASDPDEQNQAGKWPGDAKIAGRAIAVTDPARLEAFADETPPGGAHFFRIEITEVVHNQLGGDPADHMLIDYWTESGGRRQARRV